MQRIANGTQVAASPPRAAQIGTPGYYANTANGGPTRVSQEWLDDVQEEIISVIAAASITLNGAVRTQLLQAIQILIAAGANALLPDTGLANTYVVTPAIAATGYPDGYTVIFKAANANTGPSTLNVSGFGAVAIEHRDGGALQGGDIPAGAVCHCVAKGGVFQLGDAIPTLATTALEGLVKLASNATAQAGVDTASAVTPAALKATSLPLSGGELTGALTLDDDLTVAGTAEFNGPAIHAGGDTFNDTIALNGTAKSSLLAALGFSNTISVPSLFAVQELGGGLIVQVFTVSRSVSAEGEQVFVLPMSFPNAQIGAIGNTLNTANSALEDIWTQSTADGDQSRVALYFQGTSSTPGTVQGAVIIAVGF